MAVLAVSGLLGLTAVLAVGRWSSVTAMLPNRSPTTRRRIRPARPRLSTPCQAGIAAGQFNRRWLPEQTLLFVDLRLSRLAKEPPAMKSLAFLGPWWQPSSQELLHGLNLGPEQVRRLTWAATDPAHCAGSCVVVLELEEGIDAGPLLPRAKASIWGRTSWPVGRKAVPGRIRSWRSMPIPSCPAVKRPCGNWSRAAATPSWPADRWTVAEEALAGRRPGRDGRSFAGADCGGVPANLLDVWPAGKSSWQLLYRTPLALGLSVPSTHQGDANWGWSATAKRWLK